MCLASWPCYSFSEPYEYGITYNAAANGMSWSMTTETLGVPAAPGMEINGVLYRYRTVKQTNDDFKVTISNKDTQGGYIFRETDDWSGVPGNRITKFIPVELSPIARWGEGSITTEGVGQVQDQFVVYTFRFEECVNPETTPGCPGYVDPLLYQANTPQIEIYNTLEDESVTNALDPTNPDLYEEDKEEAAKEDDEKEKDKDDMEKALAASQNAITLASTISQEALVNAMNATVNMTTYYAVRIDGGAYKETQKLVDSQLPENRKGLRNGLAQQLLHDQMVDAQYK